MAVPTSTELIGNLPADVTSFVGRREELAGVKRVLSTSRLVTLTGVGGVGKTRLALKAASELQRAFDAIWMADLAGLKEPALVPQVVGAAVGLRDQSARRPVAALADFFSTRRVLLLLDNCEHLLDACADLTNALLRAAPDLRILATSRKSLRVPGESILTVAPLSIPDPDRPLPSVEVLRKYEAVDLFAARGAAILPDFEINDDNRMAVARLCQQLDGIPLAIELAAVRLRVLSVFEIAERLVDRYRWLTGGSRTAGPRQRTLRALIDWSFQLLSVPEQALWARVSVFPGAFDLEAAEFVCAGGEIATDEVAELLDGLIDNSLLLRAEHDGHARYRMLETLRQFGQEKLTGPDEQRALSRQHRDWYLWLVERAASEWFGPGQMKWFDRLRLEQPNIRAALSFCLSEPGEAESGLHMATELHRTYWLANSFFNEGRNYLDRLLEAAPEPRPIRVKALYVNAWLTLMQGDTSTTLLMLEECRWLAEKFGDQHGLAHIHHLSGLAVLHEEGSGASIQLCHDALEGFIACDDWWGVSMASLALAVAFGRQEESDRAVEMCEKVLRLTGRRGEHWCRLYALTVLAIELWHLGDIRRAASLAREGVLTSLAFSDRLGMTVDIEILAWIAETEGEHKRAVLLLGAAESIARTARVSVLRIGRYIRYHEEQEARLRNRMGDDEFARVFERGARLTLEQATAESLGEAVSSAEGPARESSPLTPREREVAGLVVQGLSNKEIAATLVVAQRTAEGHVENILSKLGFKSRAQIAAWVSAQRAPHTE